MIFAGFKRGRQGEDRANYFLTGMDRIDRINKIKQIH
jgi:hypothetical protein